MKNLPPPHLLERIANNRSATDFINSFGYLKDIVLDYLRRADLEFSSFNSILDLGCGVGRFLFAFEKEFRPHQRVFACDVNGECAEWTRANVGFAQVRHSSISPPLPYPDDSFDFLYALSVFTHLNLELQFKWSWEVGRVLKPGGVAFITVHSSKFLPTFFQPHVGDRAIRTFQSLNRGLFAYVSADGRSESEGQVYVAGGGDKEFHKEAFEHLEILRFFPDARLAGEQDLYLLRKPVDAPVIASESNGKFTLSSQRHFTVYANIPTPGLTFLDCLLTIKQSDCPLFATRVALNTEQTFGSTHYHRVDIDVPEMSGEFEISLSCINRLDDSPHDASFHLPRFY